jgi:hypothetical protein
MKAVMTEEVPIQIDWKTRRALIAKETVWEVVTELPRFASTEIGQLVGRRKAPCPLCGNDSRGAIGIGEPGVLRYEVRGKTTGVLKSESMFCYCWFWRNFFHKLDRDVPPHDRAIGLSTLAVSPKSRMPGSLQEKTIARIKADPDAGWAFFGPVGYSKTTYRVALYKTALHRVISQKIIVPVRSA